MKKNNAFTLIELLAVIVILAIIALIAIPQVLNIIGKAREKSIILSAENYKKAVEKSYISNLLDNVYETNYDGVYDVKDLTDVNVDGNIPDDGWIYLDNGKTVSYSFNIDNYIVDYDSNVNPKPVIKDDNVISERPTLGEDYNKMLVHNTGINWVFDYSSAKQGETIWENQIDDYQDFNISGGINLQDDAVYITGQTNSVLELEQMDEITIYMVAKANSSDANFLITGDGSTASSMISIVSNSGYLGYTNYINTIDYKSNVLANYYNVIAVTYDSVNKITKFYINGNLIDEKNNNGYYDANYWLGNYGSWTKDYQNYYKFISIGDTLHTDNQILENSNYLYEKYVQETRGETNIDLPIKDGINWLFNYETAVVGETVWKNQVYGYEDFNISGGINLQDDAVYITGQTNSLLKLYQLDEITIYTVAKTNSGAANLIVTGNGSTSSSMIGIISNSGYLGYTNYVNNVHYKSDILANNYNVIAATYDSVNRITKFYINGNLLDERTNNGYYEANYWLGNYGQWMQNVQNYYKFISIGNTLHTDAQILENSNYLIEKYNIED